MIKLANFNELENYFNIPGEALSFLKSITAATENKRYDFGEKCYINVQSVETKAETPLMEAHEIFIDIQCLIEGEEKIYYIGKEGLSIQRPYSENGDAALYDFDTSSKAVTYKAGEAVVLYPADAHLPNRAVSQPQTIKKAIIKLHTSCAK
jgi:YhcH/YjgK/YiaL family protein